MIKVISMPFSAKNISFLLTWYMTLVTSLLLQLYSEYFNLISVRFKIIFGSAFPPLVLASFLPLLCTKGTSVTHTQTLGQLRGHPLSMHKAVVSGDRFVLFSWVLIVEIGCHPESENSILIPLLSHTCTPIDKEPCCQIAVKKKQRRCGYSMERMFHYYLSTLHSI